MIIDPILEKEEVELVKKTLNDVFVLLEIAWKSHNVNLIDMKIEFGRKKKDGNLWLPM